MFNDRIEAAARRTSIDTTTDAFISNRHLLQEDLYHLKGAIRCFGDLLQNTGGNGVDPKPEDLYCLVQAILTKADLVEGDIMLLLD